VSGSKFHDPLSVGVGSLLDLWAVAGLAFLDQGPVLCAVDWWTQANPYRGHATPRRCNLTSVCTVQPCCRRLCSTSRGGEATVT
jgi:hypothetical protein